MQTTPSFRWLSVVTSCVIAVPAISHGADGWGAIRSMPAGYLNERDIALMQDAVVGVLEDEKEKTTRDWSNSESGHSGKVTSTRAFQSAEGRPCKKVQIDNAAGGYKSSMRYDICLSPDGNWRDADSGVPFGKATQREAAP